LNKLHPKTKKIKIKIHHNVKIFAGFYIKFDDYQGRSGKIGGHVQILKMGPYEKTRFFKQ